MDWRERIVTDPGTPFGGPCIAGTEVSVDFVLELLTAGWREADILFACPNLRRDDLRAVLAFASDRARSASFTEQATRARLAA